MVPDTVNGCLVSPLFQGYWVIKREKRVEETPSTSSPQKHQLPNGSSFVLGQTRRTVSDKTAALDGLNLLLAVNGRKSSILGRRHEWRPAGSFFPSQANSHTAPSRNTSQYQRQMVVMGQDLRVTNASRFRTIRLVDIAFINAMSMEPQLKALDSNSFLRDLGEPVRQSTWSRSFAIAFQLRRPMPQNQ